MTDKEIIKALECCANCDCENCPAYLKSGCADINNTETIKLIKKQQETISDYQHFVGTLQDCAESRRKKDLKDFAKYIAFNTEWMITNSYNYEIKGKLKRVLEIVDEKLKEMVGDEE